MLQMAGLTGFSGINVHNGLSFNQGLHSGAFQPKVCKDFIAVSRIMHCIPRKWRPTMHLDQFNINISLESFLLFERRHLGPSSFHQWSDVHFIASSTYLYWTVYYCCKFLFLTRSVTPDAITIFSCLFEVSSTILTCTCSSILTNTCRLITVHVIS